ncbi:MAG: cell division protein FtsQ/DivIB [Oscillospiraceae bacterium]
MAFPKKKKRRRRRGRIYSFFAVLAMTAAVVFGVGFFFKINEIDVSGSAYYTAEEIIEASGLHVGEGLFRFSAARAERRIVETLPYASSADINRQVPDKLIITVVDSEPAAVMQGGGGYWLVDKKLRVLENMSSSEGYIFIEGIELSEYVTAREAVVREEDRLKLKKLGEILSEFDDVGLIKRVSLIDVSQVSDISFRMDGKYSVHIGDAGDLNYKMRYLQKVLEELDPDVSGTIDLSGTKIARFIAD